MRVVLDTNVLISAVLVKRGNPHQIVSMWEAGDFDLVVSQEALDELKRVLGYPKIRKVLDARGEDVERFLDLLRTESIWVKIEERLAVVTSDETDNRYLETAVAGRAQYLVTGDRHLLDVGRYEGIEILTPATFVLLLAS